MVHEINNKKNKKKKSIINLQLFGGVGTNKTFCAEVVEGGLC